MGNKNPAIQSMLEHLAQETVRPNGADLWPAVRAGLAAGKMPKQHKEFSMNKRILVSACSAVLVLALVAVFMARNVTPVSAQAVLAKAYAAQSAGAPAQGIEHMRSEIYTNFQGLPGAQALDTTVESYRDLQSDNTRVVTTDNKTGRVLMVFAYDGAYTYSVEGASADGPLMVYRSPQGQVAGLKPDGGGDNATSKDIFDRMRSDPNVQMAGRETWDDGRTVYVLSARQQIKALVDGQIERPTGTITAYFDAETYKILGNRVTMQQNGHDVVVSSQTIQADETLPVGTHVAWDLSDLPGITLVDDPQREHGDLLPEVITRQQLAARTSTAYLLKEIPPGYSLELSEPQRKAGSSEPYMYIATYRTAANDYFVLQATGAENRAGAADTEESYTTAGGLVLHFERDYADPSGRHYVSATVEAPGGVVFLISSTLPRETLKAWAEQLVLVK